MQSVHWVSEAAVLVIHDQQIAEHGGLPGIRDEHLLKSALHNPINRYQYAENPTPNIVDLAANYACSICRNHPFSDGNKRTALVICELFLRLNGYTVQAMPLEKYEMYVQLAAGQLSESAFSAWLNTVSEKQ